MAGPARGDVGERLILRVAGGQREGEFDGGLWHRDDVVVPLEPRPRCDHVGDVGVDLEQIRTTTDILKLAERFFSPDELNTIALQDASSQRESFYRHWVAKEAFLKFKGVGLQFPLGQCRVTMVVGNASAAIDWQKGPTDSERGVVKFLPLSDGWVGAVAAEGNDWTVRLGEWTFD